MKKSFGNFFAILASPNFQKLDQKASLEMTLRGGTPRVPTLLDRIPADCGKNNTRRVLAIICGYVLGVPGYP